jgi:hypothetical protein
MIMEFVLLKSVKNLRRGIEIKKLSVFHPFTQFKFQEKMSKRAHTQALVFKFRDTL